MWKIATANRIIYAYEKYAFALKHIPIPKEFRLNIEGIYALTNHRHTVTHGSISVITSQKFFAALQVMALSYCCILDAAKIPHETIEKIMQKGIFSPY